MTVSPRKLAGYNKADAKTDPKSVIKTLMGYNVGGEQPTNDSNSLASPEQKNLMGSSPNQVN